MITTTSEETLINEWERFYRLVGLPVRSLSSVRIPSKDPKLYYFNRLIISHGDLSFSRLVQICKANFDISFPHERMERMTKRWEERYPTFKSAIWVRDVQEADVKNFRKSWRDLLREEDIGINLREMILLHLKYYLETGKHLDDKKTATLCSGTQFLGVNIPYAYFDLKANTLIIKECSKDFLGTSSEGREVRSRSVIGLEFGQ